MNKDLINEREDLETDTKQWLQSQTDLDELEQDVHPGTFRQRLKQNIINGCNIIAITSAGSLNAGGPSLHPLPIISWL